VEDARLKKYETRSLVVVITTLLILTSLSALEVSATVIWSDDCEDGNIDGWVSLNGNFTVCEYAPSEYALLMGESIAIEAVVYSPTPSMNEGTWSLDYYHKNYRDSWSEIHFFLNGTLSGLD
jgi:hypothetical protein